MQNTTENSPKVENMYSLDTWRGQLKIRLQNMNDEGETLRSLYDSLVSRDFSMSWDSFEQEILYQLNNNNIKVLGHRVYSKVKNNTSTYTHERYFTSPNHVDIPEDMPLVFLAGPVQGAPNYHDEFAETLLTGSDKIAVASPRRTPVDQIRFDSEEQVEWEFESRDRAYELGVTGIWMAAQDMTDMTYPEGRAYAQTTRIEFGETVGRAIYNKDLLSVVGFEDGYNGGSERYMRRLIKRHKLPVVSTKEEFIEQIRQKIDTIFERMS